MTAVKLTDHFADGDVERGKQRRRAMAHAVVRPALGNPGHHRLRAVKGLDLAFLIDAQHYRLRR